MKLVKETPNSPYSVRENKTQIGYDKTKSYLVFIYGKLKITSFAVEKTVLLNLESVSRSLIGNYSSLK